jgi:hypothetical protein
MISQNNRMVKLKAIKYYETPYIGSIIAAAQQKQQHAQPSSSTSRLGCTQIDQCTY